MNLTFNKVRFFFKRHYRIRRKKDFDRIFDKGKRWFGEKLIFIFLPNNLEFSRLGIIVGKKHGKAIKRNKLKRLIREVFRINRYEIKLSHDIIIIPRYTPTKITYRDIEREFLLFAERLNKPEDN